MNCTLCGFAPEGASTCGACGRHLPGAVATLPPFLAELALETPSTPVEALRIALALGINERRLRFARWLVTSGRLHEGN
jgi:hypothetical protein